MKAVQRLNHFFKQFVQLETVSGILLGIATLCALVLSNSPLQTTYYKLLYIPWFQSINFLHGINDGLMVVFFLLVSLEIKRECLEGQLHGLQQAMLPFIAALGGILMPAILYLIFNGNQPQTACGWAIPTATDIAFSLGVLSLLGKKVPLALKVFLTALAVIDDFAAILVIAFFYSKELHGLWIAVGFLSTALLLGMNIRATNHLAPYLLVGFLLWFSVLNSGIHATLAGVLLGCFIPLKSKMPMQSSPLYRLEQRLHPWVVYGILPSFAFANAGLNLSGMTQGVLTQPLLLGIFLGLIVGKPLGIVGAIWLSIKLGFARLPSALRWQHIWGIGFLGGIGFTMSLFIGTLAFPENPQFLSLVRLGIFSASLLAAVVAWLLLNAKR